MLYVMAAAREEGARSGDLQRDSGSLQEEIRQGGILPLTGCDTIAAAWLYTVS